MAMLELTLHNSLARQVKVVILNLFLHLKCLLSNNASFHIDSFKSKMKKVKSKAQTKPRDWAKITAYAKVSSTPGNLARFMLPCPYLLQLAVLLTTASFPQFASEPAGPSAKAGAALLRSGRANRPPSQPRAARACCRPSSCPAAARGPCWVLSGASFLFSGCGSIFPCLCPKGLWPRLSGNGGGKGWNSLSACRKLYRYLDQRRLSRWPTLALNK